ncbi:ABC transporter ATP-binding protein [Actinocrispum wychmicini]|uniref:ABC-2 type transport system ATP-binding protein n=1 Tax=Actinocrispum wychmicini TaxID=1213861 RepID=A0A4R2JNL7_9PSEU|nr:ABC transporter ATP-binding protein [Actinocrispum wychmicini]TCO58736.1 ABC-2 type transport system ATP-binding protein [Actinocrispum wychmicini]
MTTTVEIEAVLRVEDLAKRYGAKPVLAGCTFELYAGQVTALVGANGAGKTTLLTVLSGLLAPDGGTVVACGRVALVAQDRPLYDHLSARDMLRMARHLNLVWDEDRATRWLRRFHVPPNRLCGRLSTGQRTQVALAVALGRVPDVLLLDEPLANLDPLVRNEVMAELLTEAAETEMALLMSTHVVAELGGVADNLLVLTHGTITLAGQIDDLLANHRFYVGPRSASPPTGTVVRETHSEQQSTFLVTLETEPDETPDDAENEWVVRPATVKDIVVAHLANAREVAWHDRAHA